MATVKCPLGRRGQASHEWNDGEKDRIYCLGYVDLMTDDYLDECRDCPDHVNKAQADLERTWLIRISSVDTKNGKKVLEMSELKPCQFCSKWDWGEASAAITSGKYTHIHLACGSSRFQIEEQFNFCPVCGCVNPNKRNRRVSDGTKTD